MTVYAPEAPARAIKRPTRRTQTQTRPLELFDADTLAGLRPSPMLARLGLLDPRWWFTATDLFCGASSQTQFNSGQNIPVMQGMVSRAENPKHMPLIVFQHTMSTVPLVFGLMGQVQYTALLTARNFTTDRKVGVSFPEAGNKGVVAILGIAPLIVFLHSVRIGLLKAVRAYLNGFERAFGGTMLLIGATISGPEKLITTYRTGTRNLSPM